MSDKSRGPRCKVKGAQRLIRHSGRPIEIVYTGMSDGEKLHEDLLSIGEDGTRPFHPKITHVPVVPLQPVPEARIPTGDAAAMRVWLAQTAAADGYLAPAGLAGAAGPAGTPGTAGTGTAGDAALIRRRREDPPSATLTANTRKAVWSYPRTG